MKANFGKWLILKFCNNLLLPLKHVLVIFDDGNPSEIWPLSRWLGHGFRLEDIVK